jgi:hypothetical protein
MAAATRRALAGLRLLSIAEQIQGVSYLYALFQLGSVRQGTGGMAKDEAFAKLYAHTATFAELTGRNIAVPHAAHTRDQGHLS